MQTVILIFPRLCFEHLRSVLYTYDANILLHVCLNFFRVSLPEETQEKILQKLVE